MSMASIAPINPPLLRVIERELGKNTAKLFSEHYQGDSLTDQLTGAQELLEVVVGSERTDQLLSRIRKTL